MNESLFGTILIIIIVSYGFTGFIVRLVNRNIFTTDDGFKLKNKHLNYFLFFLMLITLVMGMLLGTKTKTTYSNVSEGFDKIRHKDDRPNPYFDIDTYW